ncbi:hypothetical protein [Aureimonas sp. AU20]|uniref:hypothetical protein n=1 Tax=Aureimonas sp. AU20 TaxID=1349819 RepID=UPI000721B25A|nr:hypothetical protein [Aureimonas sp. AU20]ALN71620.1 hypothetical protein M673_02775 [Aureimonas sp. AU20]
MRDSRDDEPPLVRVYRGFHSHWPGPHPASAPGGASRRPIYGIALCLIWFAALAGLAAFVLLGRQEGAVSLRETADYRCLDRAGERAPFVTWKRFRLGASSTPFFAATLRERPRTNCIGDGDAVTYIQLPMPPDGELSLLRIAGDGVRVEPRGGAWFDVLGKEGAIRDRNDRGGYVLASP